VLTERAARASLVVGIALALGISVAALGLRGLALAAGAGLACLVVGLVARRRIGGVTGDVLGASAELATTAALVAAVVVQA
jgi:adenosylcobinamide-GDP ribazoletransferase